MKEYIANNFVMLFELTGLLILLFISVHMDKKAKNYTAIGIALLFVNSIIHYAERWTQTFETLSMARPILTACKYSLYPFILIVIMQIVIKNVHLSKLLKLLILIPEIVSVPIFFTSQWTHLVSWFSEDNTYHGGYLSYLSYFVFVFYLIVLIVLNIISLKRYSIANKVIITFIILSPVVGVLFFLLFTENDDYNALFVSSLTVYYLFTYIHNSRIDPLTGLLNRQSYYQVMNSSFERVKAVISVDMNELKYLNDEYGHAAGDEALVTIADVLVKNSGKSASIYRIGGDEFIIYYTDVKEDEINENIKRMRYALNLTLYSCAFGYAMRTEGIDVEECVRRADKMMYEDKSRMKKEILEKGGKLHRRSGDL